MSWQLQLSAVKLWQTLYKVFNTQKLECTFKQELSQNFKLCAVELLIDLITYLSLTTRRTRMVYSMLKAFKTLLNIRLGYFNLQVTLTYFICKLQQRLKMDTYRKHCKQYFGSLANAKPV